MKEPTRNEFSSVIMGLIYFQLRCEPFFARQDLEVMSKLIDILKWYYQFSTND